MSEWKRYPVLGVHISSKWNRPAFILKRHLKRSAKRGATWMTLTEVADGKRPQAVALPGWSKAHQVAPDKAFDLGECAIMAKDEEWAIVRWRTYVIGPDLGPGNRIVMVIALLRHRLTGATLLLSTSHLPSSVEGSWRSGGHRVVQARAAIKRWRRIHLAWRRAFKPDNEATVADWNLDFHRAWVRAYFRGAWEGLSEPKRLPAGGTHGRRLIDMARTRGWNVRLRIRPARLFTDHRELWVYGWLRYRR